MRAPIPPEKAEELIMHYVKLKYQLLRGQVSKLGYFLEMKAKLLGFGRTVAWNMIRHAKEIGMIEASGF